MAQPTNDTAKILAAIQASEDRTAAKLDQQTQTLTQKIDASTNEIKNAVTSSTSATSSAIEASQAAVLEAIAGISVTPPSPTPPPADNTEVLAAISSVDTHVGKVEEDLALVAQDVKDIKTIVSTAPPPNGGGGTVPSVPDKQPVWHMTDATITPTGTDPASTVAKRYSFGTGPDTITIGINSSNHTDKPLASVAIFCGTNYEKQVGDSMTPGCRNGTSPGDVFEFHGDYPDGIPIDINKDPAFNGAWVISVALNDRPYETTGNYDGTQKTTQGPIFNSKEANMHWVLAGTSGGGGSGGGGGGGPAPTEDKATFVVTATDGTVRTIGPDLFKNLSAQVQLNEVAVMQEAAIKSPGGTFSANCTFKGKDGTRAKIDATGFPQASFPGNGKAVLLFAAGTSLFTVGNLEILGAHIPSSAGANIAALGEKTLGTVTVNIQNCYIHDCDDGVAVGVGNRDANTVLERCGGVNPPQPTHNSYTKEELGEQIITGGSSLSALTGYVEKTRCQKGTIDGTTYVIDQQSAAGGSGGINLARGGTHTLKNLKIKHTPNVQDLKIVSFFTEAPDNVPTANALRFLDSEIDTGGGSVILVQNGTQDPNATLDLTGTTVVAGGSATIKGFKAANVTPTVLPANITIV